MLLTDRRRPATRRVIPLSIVYASLCGSGAWADLLSFSLSGADNVPPINTPGSGSGVVLVDPDTGQIELSGSYIDLLGETFAAHIHGVAPGGNVFLIGLNHTGGTDGTLSVLEMVPLAQAHEILAGRTYVNVHTTLFPNGEIRGTIVPEPGAAALLGLCAVPLLCGRRMRTRP